MPEPDQPELESVRILRLQPGDTIVVRVADYYSQGTMDDIKLTVGLRFPDHKVLVLGPNTDLEILRDGTDA